MLLEQINKEDIAKVITYSQNIDNPKIDELLENWANAKKEISSKFLEGKTHYTFPEKVQFHLSQEAKSDRLVSFIEFIANIFNDYSHPLVRFLSKLSSDEFFLNTLSTDYIIDAKENKKIQAGTKIIKSFKYFIDEEKLLRDLQNKASELIQENKVEGYLTFSIHPLDFLSSSENTYNWRSCHALDGEYRAGNLSYMCDQGTMIVYLAPEDKVKLPHFPEDVPWNSKKWRVLLHFGESLDVCFAGRQYPFFSPGALDCLFNIFSENMVPHYVSWGCGYTHREKWLGWYDDYITEFNNNNGRDVGLSDGWCVINSGIFNIRNIVSDAENSRHFNDVLRSSCYEKPYYMFRHYWNNENISIKVGSEVMCLHCGQAPIDGDDSMMCHECECQYGTSDSDAYRTCDCCGTRFWHEEGYWVGEDDCVCPNCVETQTFVCESCGVRVFNSEKHWDKKKEGYICNYCHNFEEEE